MDIFGQDKWVPFHKFEGGACLELAVVEYLPLRKLGNIFISHEDGLALTWFQFSAMFKRLLVVGEQAKEYCTHSFRIGAAIEALRMGLPSMDIQRIGRWRLACFTLVTSGRS